MSLHLRRLAVLSVALLVGACGSSLVQTSPSPASQDLGSTASPTTSPRPPATKPYHLLLGGRDRVIRSPADCAPLPSAWLRDYCALTLRGDWRVIATDSDPQIRSASWYAAITRAEIDGDLSLCDDVRMRTWLSLPTMGGAPVPGATPAPRIGPIAKCRHELATPTRPGEIDIEDESAPPRAPLSVTITFPPPTIAALPSPTFDPSVICGFNGMVPMSAKICAAILVAIQRSSDLSSASILGVSVRPSLTPCDPPSPCDMPATGTPLGSATIGYGSDRAVYVNAWSVDGRVALTEVTRLPSPTQSCVARCSQRTELVQM